MNSHGKEGTDPDPLTWSSGSFDQKIPNWTFSEDFGLACWPYYTLDLGMSKAGHTSLSHLMLLEVGVLCQLAGKFQCFSVNSASASSVDTVGLGGAFFFWRCSFCMGWRKAQH